MTTEFKHGTRFQESRRLCGHENCGCHDLELAGVHQQCHMGVTGHNRPLKPKESAKGVSFVDFLLLQGSCQGNTMTMPLLQPDIF